MNCQALFKGTQVDGVYSAEPAADPNAIRYDTLTYLQVLADDLKVMDASAISIARENRIPILVYSLHQPEALADVLAGRGTWATIAEEA